MNSGERELSRKLSLGIWLLSLLDFSWLCALATDIPFPHQIPAATCYQEPQAHFTQTLKTYVIYSHAEITIEKGRAR